MLVLAELSKNLISIVFVAFCRACPVFMMIPGFSEQSVPKTVRLYLCIATSVAISAMLTKYFPTPVGDAISAEFLGLILREFCIGLTIGTIVKIAFHAIQIAGASIASSIGLGMATLFDPVHNTSGNTVGVFVTIAATLLMISADMHLLVLHELFRSYVTIPAILPQNDLFQMTMTESIVEVMKEAWICGLRIASPFIALNFLIMLAGGILSRLLPQLQLFTLTVPAQILSGFVLLVFSIQGMLSRFLLYYSSIISQTIEVVETFVKLH